MIRLEKVKDALEVLQDKEKQIRVWTGDDDYPWDPVEMICSLFDDSGLSLAMEEGKARGFLGEPLASLLVQLSDLVDRIDWNQDQVSLANIPEMEEIRQLAQQALFDPVFKSV